MKKTLKDKLRCIKLHLDEGVPVTKIEEQLLVHWLNSVRLIRNGII
jgi:transposase-like protein